MRCLDVLFFTTLRSSILFRTLGSGFRFVAFGFEFVCLEAFGFLVLVTFVSMTVLSFIMVAPSDDLSN